MSVLGEWMIATGIRRNTDQPFDRFAKRAVEGLAV
jgi:hypothetical protein